MEAALSVLETLTREAISFSKKLQAVKEQITTLKHETVSFKANLEIWTKKPIKDERLKALVIRYREAVYEAEDIVDDYVVENAKYQSKNRFAQLFSFNRHGKLVKLTEKIQKIIDESKEIRNNWSQVEASSQGGEESQEEKTLKKVAKVENNVVGFAKEQQKIINDLLGGSNELEVTSIAGMSGLGKTTLAKRILLSPEIKGAFQKRISVSVTQNCNIQEVFSSILKHFSEDNEKIEGMTIEELANELRIYSTRENYIILMDDVHIQNDWDDIITAFPGNKMKSRILLTTRYLNVAKHACSNKKEPITLGFLDKDESWELLKLKALGSDNCSNNLETLGREIAKQCGGLPLTIVLVGGILSEKGKKSSAWDDVSKDIGRYIDPNKPDEEKRGVDLSFYELSYHRKACFIYFGMFPKGSKLPVKNLISMWIAEGFIQQERDRCLETIAEEYLDELVNKSLVLIENWSSNGKMKTCYVHDVVHEFCRSKAEEENLYQVIGKNYQRTHSSDNFDLHRVCIHHSDLGYISSGHLGTRVRSFLCSFPEKIRWQPENSIYLFKKNKLLRVFHGESITFPRFPSDLSQLLHLRFLVLHTDDKILPECISYLWNLQTLIVYSSSEHTLEIKGDTGKMTQLRQLKTNASTSWKALSKSKKDNKVSSPYCNLTILLMVSPETCTKDAFERAPNLEKLGIRGQLARLFEVINGGRRSLFHNVIEQDSLESLKLVNHPMDPSNPKSKIVSLPKEFPSKLRKLTLVNTHIEWKYMYTLGNLQKLVILKLKGNAFEGSKWEMNEEECFRGLEVLHIEETDLVVWKACDSNFPSLTHLYLRRCTQLRRVPLQLARISSLEKLELRGSNPSAVNSAKKIEQKKGEYGFKAFELTIDSAI